MKKIHIVSFANPYPPDYGGAIDIFYKVKALGDAGIRVILHIFEYNGRTSPLMEELCEEVYYYPRKTGWLSQLSFRPYIVNSRMSAGLLENLGKDSHPVLFEGLHTCLYLDHPILGTKIKSVRTHNIEHVYYKKLADSTSNPMKKLFYRIEAFRLRSFEKILRKADHIFAISPSDNEYFREKYGNSSFVGAFHSNSEVSSAPGQGNFILMHGNLGVEENEHAALHCIRNIFNHINFPVVIAGKNPTERLKTEVSGSENIILSGDPGESEMESLLHDAHIHLCYTFQASGLKLKLLNSLYRGRFVISNPLMTLGSGLEELTINGNTDGEIINKINETIQLSFGPEMISERKSKLDSYGNRINAAKIIQILGF